jgi:hypothetical protein
MAKVPSPCYDELTKTDCPRRHSGCAINCPEWAEYEKQREEEYRRRARELEADRSLIGNAASRASARQKKWMADRQNRR